MLPLIIAGGMAAKGLYDGYQNNKKTAAEQKYNKAVIEFSPWTKMAPQEVKDRPGMLSSAIGGGVSGLAIGQDISKAGFGGGAEATPAATAAPIQTFDTTQKMPNTWGQMRGGLQAPSQAPQYNLYGR